MTPGRVTGNLPAELTSFVGHRGELAEVRRLLAGSRLVTLTGPGGVGKTRLALRVAAGLARAFRDGVWLVRLDQLRDEALVAQAVAGALGLQDRAGFSPEAAVPRGRSRWLSCHGTGGAGHGESAGGADQLRRPPR